MKVFSMLFLLLCISVNSQAQANTALSNLSPNTKINTSLKPKTTGTIDLGKKDSAWKNLYLNGSLFLGGKETVRSVTDLNDNMLFGNGTGWNITTGKNNIAIGNNSLNQNQDGNGNIAIGNAALFLNTASSNTVVGDYAMMNNTTGYQNSAFGYKSLYSNKGYSGNSFVSGLFNSAFGSQTLYSNTYGGANSAFGSFALSSNTTGVSNTALGYDALTNNTTAYQNTAIGVSCMSQNTTGTLNVATGFTALYSNSTGSWNTAIGTRALYTNTEQDKNTALGWSAGDGAQSAASTYVGYNAHASAIVSNSTALGINAIVTASSQVRIGSNAVTSIGGYVNWSNISDGRVKKNIKQNVPGLAFINKLTPITYNLDLNAADRFVESPDVKNENGKALQPDLQESALRKAKEQVVYTGLIAQDVERAANALNYNFSGIDAAKNDKDLYSLRYADFVVPLVKAVQELSKQNEHLQNQINEFKKALAANSTSKGMLQSHSSAILNDAELKQNIPNPFNANTAINYFIPSSAIKASISISNSIGQVIKVINLTNKGKGTTNIGRGDLSAGTYYYSLIIDGKQTATKEMLITK